MGFGFRVSGFGFHVSGFGFRVSGFGFRVEGLEFRVVETPAVANRRVVRNEHVALERRTHSIFEIKT